MTTVVLRSAQAGAILTALSLSAGLMTGVAEAAPPRDHSCLSPIFQDSQQNSNWRDLNLRYGVSQRIIGPPPPATDDIADPPGKPGCRTALAGEQWVRAVPPWITASEALQKLFIANFKGARYVIDGGTRQEFTVTAGPGILQKGLIPTDLPPTQFPGRPWVAPVSPVIHPLSVGNHTSTLFVNMAAETCNGLEPVPTNAPGLKPGANCLPEGESEYPVADNGGFTVLTGPPPPTPTTTTSPAG